MTSPAQRVLEVVVIDPRWRLELRQEVPGCFNNDKRNRGVSFYKFPKDKELKKIWLQKNRQTVIEFVVNTSKVRRLMNNITSARTANTIPSDRSSEAVIQGGKEF